MSQGHGHGSLPKDTFLSSGVHFSSAVQIPQSHMDLPEALTRVWGPSLLLPGVCHVALAPPAHGAPVHISLALAALAVTAHTLRALHY